ncbi:beta-mannosidase [Paenibacillus sp. YIM B09110]|uniref:beta-mannosidase n=1 Tax=Paenibacillus sp. YIM B09110 TaxID=3126102 RepID=UPI00301B8127
MIKLLLDGTWQLTHERSHEAYRAQVPGFVQRDLALAGVVPDENDPLFESKVEWIEHDDWEYRRKFSLSEEMLQSDALDLLFEGIDTYASVTLNGVEIGKTELMFVPYRFGIKGVAKLENELVVSISSPTAVLAEKEKLFGEQLKLWNGSTVRLQGRKAQYGYGWDWGPRLVTVGIHKSVSIEAYDAIQAERLGYNLTRLSEEKAILNASFSLRNVREESLASEIVYRLYEGDTVCAEKREAVKLRPGDQKLSASFEVANPKLWYPAGYGSPHLYRLEVSVVSAAASVQLERTVGIREVKISQPYKEKGRRFIIEVNGIPMLCKGVNWIPLTLYPNQDTREDYRREIDAIAAGNMNMIRIWGGGVYESQSFFDECDEKGIMVWQDFMFACGDYPDDDTFCELVRQEVDYIITEYGYHPSIVLWCGNNENMTFIERSRKHRAHGFGEKIFFDLMYEVCAQDTLRPYWPSSPYAHAFDHNNYEGTYGDQHYWHVWGRTEPYENYRNIEGSFLSEFGMQSYPSNRVMNKVDASGMLHGEKIHAIQKGVYGHQKLMYYITADYHLPARRDDYVYLSQLMQANALRTGVEHWISRMPDTSGVLVWQWSDLWPSISWSIQDFDKVQKASYFYLKRSFQTPNALLKVEIGASAADVYVIHEQGGFSGGVAVEWYDLDNDAVIDVQQFEVKLDGHQATLIGQVDLGGYNPSRIVAFVELFDEAGQLLAVNSYLLCKPYDLKLRPAKLTVAQKQLANGDIELTVTSDTFAKDVSIPDVAALLSDNFFDLRANESKIITVHQPALEDMKFEAICLNNVPYIGY